MILDAEPEAVKLLGAGQKDLFLNQVEGYVKALEKSTSLPRTQGEVFDSSTSRVFRVKNLRPIYRIMMYFSRPVCLSLTRF